MREFLFVGETRSQQAKDHNWTWQSGRSTAKYLWDALKAVGIEPTEQEFTNLWSDDGELQPIQSELKVVAMGRTVQNKLNELGVKHIDIVHPAARGIYKRKEVYSSHLREKLT